MSPLTPLRPSNRLHSRLRPWFHPLHQLQAFLPRCQQLLLLHCSRRQPLTLRAQLPLPLLLLFLLLYLLWLLWLLWLLLRPSASRRHLLIPLPLCHCRLLSLLRLRCLRRFHLRPLSPSRRRLSLTPPFRRLRP